MDRDATASTPSSAAAPALSRRAFGHALGLTVIAGRWQGDAAASPEPRPADPPASCAT